MRSPSSSLPAASRSPRRPTRSRSRSTSRRSAVERLLAPRSRPSRSRRSQPGWEDAWRAFHRPVRVGGLWIGPPWEQPDPGELAVVIDPGRAFGTGAHPTTRLCVELLATLRARIAARRRLRLGRALDRGGAPRLRPDPGRRQRPGRRRDDDRERRGQRRRRSRPTLVDGESDELPRADVAVANVLLAPVERILARLDARFAITSGYLTTDHPVGARLAARRSRRARRLGGRSLRAAGVARRQSGRCARA